MTAALVTGPVLLTLFAIAAVAMLVMALFLAAIWRKQVERDKAWHELQQTVTGLVSDQRYYLTARNLGPLHEKINAVGTDVAETRTEMRTEMRATREQLRLINDYLRNPR